MRKILFVARATIDVNSPVAKATKDSATFNPGLERPG
jgi:hypothetical protein